MWTIFVFNQHSNAFNKSSVYLVCCLSSVNMIHPSSLPSAISARFFLARDRVLWPVPTLKPNCLLISLIKISLCGAITVPLLLVSFVGVRSRPRQSALTTERFAMLVQHWPLFLSGEFWLHFINFLAHLNNCCPSLISFMLIPMDEEMCWMDGSDNTHRQISRCCSNVLTHLRDFITLVAQKVAIRSLIVCTLGLGSQGLPLFLPWVWFQKTCSSSAYGGA